MLTNLYEVDRMARDLSRARLAEADNERRAQIAREAARARQAESGCDDAEANSRGISVLPSRLIQLIRG